jgi:hypothetical protein
MRETCARVLAAALMTGAIGFALAMPAFFGSTPDADRSLTAPPSSLLRSVDLLASAPSRPARHVDTQPFGRAVYGPAVPAASPHSRPARPSKPSPKPTPTPAPTSGTRELASDTLAAPVTPPAPSQPTTSGNGKGKGHDKPKEKGKPQPEPPPPVPATTPSPPEESPQPESEKDHGHDNGKGNDKDKDKGRGE